MIVGGGIAGLSAAWEIQRSRPDWKYSLLEAGNAWGGKVTNRVIEADGIRFLVDGGPDLFTTRLRAGLLVGVWGVASMTGHALGSLLGGVTVDTVRALTGSAFAAYGTVFGLEMTLLLVAFGLSLRLDVDSSKARVEERQTLSPGLAK